MLWRMIAKNEARLRPLFRRRYQNPALASGEPDDQNAENHGDEPANAQRRIRRYAYLFRQFAGDRRKAAIKQPFDHQKQTQRIQKIGHGNRDVTGQAGPQVRQAQLLPVPAEPPWSMLRSSR